MSKRTKFYPGFDDENQDRDKELKDELDETRDIDDLKFNPDKNSYEIDVDDDGDPDYDHPDPYDTDAPNGEDDNSDWDEANPYVGTQEYDKDASLEHDADQLGMHIDDGSIVEVDPVDEKLAETPEDYRDDLDEEGYPKNDRNNLK
ncbi:hypothetical protein FW774_16595 [Pedobacter sp. BS3]|uniref:hypothetical protein n=1 Tax=Pedobacter sp. BS3 TaxID=2567937 RepID=UPI0011EE05C6|nr:hypothetical protein [Pedobacter sp. BS3]TZF82302.1 hypothetical protein FW774_16595 [Pedobacter sp. BS3]